MAYARDILADLVARQLTAFPGLRALRDLDLQIVSVDEIFDGDSKPPRSDLLYLRAHGIAVGQRFVTIGFLAAFAGVRAAADAIHGDRERGMRLAGNRAEAHRASGEALHDIRRGLDFFQRNRV